MVFISLLKILSSKRIEKVMMMIRCNGSCFFMVSFLIFMGFTMAERPITSIVLTIVLPMTFARTISSFPDSNP